MFLESTYSLKNRTISWFTHFMCATLSVSACGPLRPDAQNQNPTNLPSNTGQIRNDQSSDTGQTKSPLVAPFFDGITGFVEIPDHDAYSVGPNSTLTIEAWIRPDALTMPRQKGSGYVNWLGKGAEEEHEWVFRFHNAGSTEGRDHRMSFIAFNPDGLASVGSYYQDELTAGQWIHVVGQISQAATAIHRDGTFRDSDLLTDGSPEVVPANRAAPIRIATRNFGSYFQGAISHLAIYSETLDDTKIQAHHQAGRKAGYRDLILAEPSLVGYWPLNETSGTTAFDLKNDNHGAYHDHVILGAAQWSE